MKKRLATMFIMLLSLVLIFAGCGSNDTSKSDAAKTKDKEKDKTEVTSGASKTSYTDPSKLKDTYDIVIIGAGGAGMSAALEAKAKGLNPVILEKMPLAGGNTMKASSGMNASETKFQKEQGINDSNDKFFDHFNTVASTSFLVRCYISF